MHLLLFFIIQFIAVFQTKVKGTDRRLEFTEQPDCMLAPSESLTNSKYKREYDSDTETINTFIERIGVLIDKLNIAIASGNKAWAGSLLTTFSRHLREILNESATNQIEFSTCTTHVEHLLSLLSSINKNSWGFEISDHKIFDMDNSRYIRSLAIMPWITDILWEAVINDQPIDYVGIEISSDSYEATYTMKFGGKEMIRSIPFIEGIRGNEE